MENFLKFKFSTSSSSSLSPRYRHGGDDAEPELGKKIEILRCEKCVWECGEES